jgi:hypothetical protein
LAEAASPYALCPPKRNSKIFSVQPKSFLFQRAGYGEDSISDLGDGLFDEDRSIEEDISSLPPFNYEASLAE